MKNGSKIIQVYISPEDLTSEGVIKDIKEYGLNTARGKPNIYEYDESINPEKRFKPIVDLFSYAAYYKDVFNPIPISSTMIGGGNNCTFKQFMPMTNAIVKEIIQKVLSKVKEGPSIELLMQKLGSLYREYFQQKMFGSENVLVFTVNGVDIYLKAEHYYKKVDDDDTIIIPEGKYFTTNSDEGDSYKSDAKIAAKNAAEQASNTASERRNVINEAASKKAAEDAVRIETARLEAAEKEAVEKEAAEKEAAEKENARIVTAIKVNEEARKAIIENREKATAAKAAISAAARQTDQQDKTSDEKKERH